MSYAGWMRRHISLKSNTYTESLYVDAAGISGKVGAHYPGRSVVLLCATVVKRRQDENRNFDVIQEQKMNKRIHADSKGRERNSQEYGTVRYTNTAVTDDCNIYVATRRSGIRVLESITKFLESKLKLKVNQKKSTVARPWKRKFIGYSMTFNKQAKLKVAPESVKRFKDKVRQAVRRGRGRNLQRYLTKTAVIRNRTSGGVRGGG